MMLVLVFSRDRALQLDALLNSCFLHVADAGSAQLTVIYHASTEKLAAQYAELARQHGGQLRFVPEKAFRRDVLEILASASPAFAPRTFAGVLDSVGRGRDGIHPATKAETHAVLFLVDDCLFVRPFRLSAAREALEANPDALGFSLRLGCNTTQCYVLRRAQALPRFEAVATGVLKYNWTKADGDFGYPLEVSSSLYRWTTIMDLLGRMSFRDPNTLESQMSLQKSRFERRQPFLLCLEQSAAFSAPMNRVQSVYDNRSGEAAAFNLENLADRFDRGQRINVQALAGFVPSACHQEVELTFEQRTL
jgi:hypothetical protein